MRFSAKCFPANGCIYALSGEIFRKNKNTRVKSTLREGKLPKRRVETAATAPVQKALTTSTQYVRAVVFCAVVGLFSKQEETANHPVAPPALATAFLFLSKAGAGQALAGKAKATQLFLFFEKRTANCFLSIGFAARPRRRTGILPRAACARAAGH